MNPYLATVGIRFNDCVFSEPARLLDWAPPKYAGICAILTRDANWAPKPLQPLCFLEFGNNSDLGLARLENMEALFVSVLAMPFSTTAQRTEILNQLVSGYNPVWQNDVHRLREPKRRAIGFLPENHTSRKLAETRA